MIPVVSELLCIVHPPSCLFLILSLPKALEYHGRLDKRSSFSCMQVLTRAPSLLGGRIDRIEGKLDVLGEYLGREDARKLVIAYSTVRNLLLFVWCSSTQQ